MEVIRLEQFVGKRCKIFIDFFGTTLVYTAHIQSVTQSHVTFCDKFNKNFAFNNLNVIEIEEIGGD
jgi:hypothetical protein